MILDTLTKLEAVLAGVITTNQPDVVVDYVDYSPQNKPTLVSTVTTPLNSTTDVTILAAPTNPRREPVRISIYNRDTASATVIVKTDKSGTERPLIRVTLLTLETLNWENGLGWYALTATGQRKEGAGVAGPGTSTDNAVARFDGTGGTQIQNSGVIVDDSNNVTGIAALTTSGNATLGDAVGDAHTITGAVTITDDSNALACVKSGGDMIRIVPQNAGTGANIHVANSAGTDYEPLDIIGETIQFYRRSGVLTAAEAARIDASGTLLVGKTGSNSAVAGVELAPQGTGYFTRDGQHPVYVNRLTDDGNLIVLDQAGVTEGTISVSGTTISYVAFLGSHWSQLADGSRADILPGSVMSTIDALCEWPGEENDRLPKCEVCDTPDSERVYGVFLAWDNDEFRDEQATEEFEEKFSEVREIDGKFVMVNDVRKVKRPLFTEHPIVNEDGTPHLVKVREAVYEGKGDARKKVADEVWQQATHQKPAMVKRRGVNDMYVAAIGQYRVRLRKGEAFQNGDLVVAAGGGCAKVNNDAKPNQIIGKINCAVVIETYPDGSFTVPCALYCG